MNQQMLKNVLEMHRKWVMNEEGGKRANFSNADLSGCSLYGANLRGANLYCANLYGANLDSANLYGANLRGANLDGANLYDANLDGANLRGANLYCANLRGANLYGANLRGANLDGANLRGANLDGANLYEIRKDFFQVLTAAKAEVLGLYDALQKGRIDGTCYEGECCCLVGTIANLRSENYQELSIELKPKEDRPAEKWFLAIREGHTPQSNPVAKIVAEWIEAFAKKNSIELPKYKLVSNQDVMHAFSQSYTTEGNEKKVLDSEVGITMTKILFGEVQP